MKVLFDQGTPAPLRKHLSSHLVETAHERGWSLLKNGELLSAAESAAFEIFVTTDTKLKYQQNLSTRVISIVVLLSTSWPRIQRCLPRVIAAADEAIPGGYVEVLIE
jgi:predicted nuclease of predicted toxin-antitoxin system